MEINTNNLVVDIERVKPNGYNPKIFYKDNPANLAEFEKIKRSIEVAGQIQPVLVRELEDGTYEIINGFHRYSAMTELGYKQIEIKNLGKLDFETAVSRALLTEDTKVPIDNLELAGLMKKVVTEEKPAEYWAKLLPYTPEVIKQKIELVDFDFAQYDEAGTDGKIPEDDDAKFSFRIPADGADICNEALELAHEDKNSAFIEICRSYVEMSK